MKRLMKQKVTEYIIPITLYWEYQETGIAASSKFDEMNPSNLIRGIADMVAENVELLGFELIENQQRVSNKSEAYYVRFKCNNMEDVIITFVFRFAEYKANKGFMKSDIATQKVSNGKNYITVSRWFDVAGVEKNDSVKLTSFIAKILYSIKEGNLDIVYRLPKHITKEYWM